MKQVLKDDKYSISGSKQISERLMIQWLISLKENLCSNLLPINCKFKEGKTLSDLEKLGSNILIMGTNQLRKDLAYLQCSCVLVIHGHKCLIMAT